MTLQTYYQKELTKLRNEAAEFSATHPDLARALNFDAHQKGDPHIERLLEGCAFLTAKIHQMVDSDRNKLPEQLIERLWPQMVEGFPSVTLAQMTVKQSLTEPFLVKRGTPLSSLPVGEGSRTMSCHFETTRDMVVYPIELKSVTHDTHAGERLTLSFVCHQQANWSKIQCHTIPLYLHCDSSKAMHILKLMISNGLRIDVRADDQLLTEHQVRFTLPAVNPSSSLSEASRSGLNALQSVFEYFCFPQAIQQVEITGLDSLVIPAGTHILTIECVSHDEPLHYHAIEQSDFRLFVVPCINQYVKDCEPIKLDHQQHRYALNVQHQFSDIEQAIRILTVEAMDEVTHQTCNYYPLSDAVDASIPYYVVHREPYAAHHTKMYLSFHSPSAQKQIVSVNALCTQKNLPRRYIRAGDLSLAEPSYMSSVSINNITTPSAFIEPPTSHLSNRLLQYLVLQLENISDAASLQHILSLLNIAKLPHMSQRIDGIAELSHYQRSLIHRGVYYQVHGIRLTLTESHFPSLSDCYVFGYLLHHAFEASAPLHVLVETTCICLPSEATVKWVSEP